MVINGIGNKIALYNQNKISQEKESPLQNKTRTSDIKSESDKVELSNQGKLLTTLLEKAREEDIVRKEKVKELKDKINSGEYKIDVKEVAKKLVENEIDLYL